MFSNLSFERDGETYIASLGSDGTYEIRRGDDVVQSGPVEEVGMHYVNGQLLFDVRESQTDQVKARLMELVGLSETDRKELVLNAKRKYLYDWLLQLVNTDPEASKSDKLLEKAYRQLDSYLIS